MKQEVNLHADPEVASTIAQYLVDFECDIASLIYIDEKKIDFCFASDEYKKLPQYAVLDFEQHRQEVAMTLFEEEDRDYYLERTSLTTICKELEQKTKYIFRCHRIQNGKKHHKLYAYIRYPGKEDVLIFFIKDISYQVILEETQIARLNESIAQIEKESLAKAHFFSNMSHDMRTPMNAVLNLTEICMERMDDKVFLRENLQKIQESGKFLLNLINDCLDMQKIESGKVELHPEVYEYEEFISYVHSVFEPLCKKKNITLKVPVYIEAPVAYIDKLRLHQIFLNLISNAIYYTDEGGEISVDVNKISQNGNQILYQFVIRDNGEGMSEAFQKKMFEPFAQEKKKKNKNRGTGLGLPIALKTVKLLGGSMDVKSELGKGTEFRVNIPFVLATQEQIAAQKKGSEILNRGNISLQGKHVLIAEDQPLNREILQCILEGEGMIVTAVENGKNCVDTLLSSSKNEYQGAILDIRMPVMDGLETARIIRGMERKDLRMLPLIALSANAFVEDMEEAIKAGMNDYIVKPFERQKLRQTLMEYLI